MRGAVVIVFYLIFLSACISDNRKDKTVADELVLNTHEEKGIYLMGVMMGRRISLLHFSPREIEILMNGVKDSATRRVLRVNEEGFRPIIQGIYQTRLLERAEIEKREGKKILSGYDSRGFSVTKSGLRYKIVSSGNIKKAKPADIINLKYLTKLPSGKIVASNLNEPISFQLNSGIKAWEEGLQLIGEGGKIELVAPSDLTYGDYGDPPTIPGGMPLIFEMELIDITTK